MNVRQILRYMKGHWRSAGFFHLERNVLEVNDIGGLGKAFGWSREPSLGDAYLDEYEFHEDLNERRKRDAEVLGLVAANAAPTSILEIGTGHGYSTAILARNAPWAMVHTVNIPPEEIGDGGRYTTFAPAGDEIGQYYKEQGLRNVRQIFTNTASWKPDICPVDVAFIDGSHDAAFVYSDTKRVLEVCRPGSIILWHDFSPSLSKAYPWIASVCRGVERLYEHGALSGKILHLVDSWIGLYQVPRRRDPGTQSRDDS